MEILVAKEDEILVLKQRINDLEREMALTLEKDTEKIDQFHRLRVDLQ